MRTPGVNDEGQFSVDIELVNDADLIRPQDGTLPARAGAP